MQGIPKFILPLVTTDTYSDNYPNLSWIDLVVFYKSLRSLLMIAQGLLSLAFRLTICFSQFSGESIFIPRNFEPFSRGIDLPFNLKLRVSLLKVAFEERDQSSLSWKWADYCPPTRSRKIPHGQTNQNYLCVIGILGDRIWDNHITVIIRI